MNPSRTVAVSPVQPNTCRRWLRTKSILMNTLKITILLVIGSAATLLAADEPATPISLESARVSGRLKSRFLKEADDAAVATDAIPKANVAFFRESVGPILKKSCLACHGPEKSEGRLRIDQLNPDLLGGPDVERWREVFNALGKSEMPPKDEPDYALAETDRGTIVDWLSTELTAASLVRRNSKEHSSFRRLTNYEYNYALQDLLGLPTLFQTSCRRKPHQRTVSRTVLNCCRCLPCSSRPIVISGSKRSNGPP